MNAPVGPGGLAINAPVVDLKGGASRTSTLHSFRCARIGLTYIPVIGFLTLPGAPTFHSSVTVVRRRIVTGGSTTV
jgi:hypothetical protein